MQKLLAIFVMDTECVGTIETMKTQRFPSPLFLISPLANFHTGRIMIETFNLVVDNIIIRDRPRQNKPNCAQDDDCF